MARWTKPAVRLALRTWHKKHGHWPTSKDFTRIHVGGQYPAYKEIRRVFPSFGAALKESGCEAGVALPTPAATIARFPCGCGCGHSVNPNVERVVDLREARLSHREIATRLGVTRECVSTLLRNPPRFVKGHSAFAYWSGVRAAVPAWHDGFLGRREYEARSAQRQLRLRRARVAAILMQPFASEARQALIEYERQQELAALVEESAELAALVAEQDQDARWGYRTWTYGLRLDKEVAKNGSDYWSRQDLHNFVGGSWLAASPLDDPLQVVERAETESRLLELVGTLEPDDILRTDGQTLYRIRDKLIAEGFVPQGVTRAERERLREPATHAGIGRAKAPLIPGRKKRREKIAHKEANRNRGNSNRPAQKPRRRWDRDEPIYPTEEELVWLMEQTA